MAEKREEELSRLYVLRAGLSVIGREDNAFREAAKREYDAHISERRRLEAVEGEMDANQAEQRRAAETSQLAKNAVRTYSKNKRWVARSVFFILLGAGLLFGCAMIVIGICGYENVLGEDWLSNPFYHSLFAWWEPVQDSGWFGLVIIVGGLICLIGGGVALWRGFAIFASGPSALVHKKRAENTVQSSKDKAGELAAAFQALLAEKTALLNKIGGRDLDAFTKHYAKQGDCHLIAGEAFYLALAKQYKGFLDVRDWQYLDYLIYLYETGRADDIKEALQLLDRELQTERLETAIENAAARIERSIERGLRNLQAQMETCFYRLSEEIRSSTRQIVSSIGSLNAQIRQNATATNAYLKQISSAAAINNALQASANKSSAQLVDQVRALREYASMMR